MSLKRDLFEFIRTALNETADYKVNNLSGNKFTIRNADRIYSPEFDLVWMGEGEGQTPHFVAYYIRNDFGTAMFSIYTFLEAVEFVNCARIMNDIRCKRMN